LLDNAHRHSNFDGFTPGEVYKQSGNYFLAVDFNKLLACRNGVIVEQDRNNYKYITTTDISVSELGRKWGIHIEAIENAARKFFIPDESGRMNAVPDFDPDAPIKMNSTAWRRIRERAPSVRRGRVILDRN